MPLSDTSAFRPARRHEELGPAFFDRVAPADFPNLRLRFRNQRWAQRVGLAELTSEEWLDHFGRFAPFKGSLDAPLALRYHGHQFQVYNPQLGDGRGFLFAQCHDLEDGRDPTWPLVVAEAGSLFSLEVSYFNLAPEHLGLLLLVMGQGEPPICPQIGAGKSAGLGAVRFEDLQLKAVNPDSLYELLDSRDAQQPVDKDACLHAAQELLRQDDAWAIVARALSFANL